MSVHLTHALTAVETMNELNAPALPWEPTDAMIKAARPLGRLDDQTIRAMYAAMLAANGNMV